MLLTLRAQYSAGVTPRAAADAIISALTPAAWYRNATDVVSSGGFASIWADYASTAQGLVLPGVSGNTPSVVDAAYWPTGDYELIARVMFNDWTPVGAQTIVSKWGAAPYNQFLFLLNTDGTLASYGSSDGTSNRFAVNSTVSVSGTDGVPMWVKMVRDSAGGTVAFYKAADSATVPSSWTQVGTTVAATAGSIASVASQFKVGCYGGGTAATGASSLAAGMCFRVIVKDGIDGTTVFDADFSAQAIGAGSFTESSSNAATVTINTSGAAPAHIGKARDLLQGTGTNQPAYAAGVFTFDGADNYMVAATWLQAQPTTIYYVLNPNTWTGSDQFSDGTAANSGWVYQTGVTPAVSLYAGGAPAAANTTVTVGAYHVVCVVFNGASSSIRADNSAKTTGNPGATGMGGFTLAARASAASPSNILVKEVVIFGAAHDDTTQDSVVTAYNDLFTVF